MPNPGQHHDYGFPVSLAIGALVGALAAAAMMAMWRSSTGRFVQDASRHWPDQLDVKRRSQRNRAFREHHPPWTM